MKKWKILLVSFGLCFTLFSKNVYAENDLDTVSNDGTRKEFVTKEARTTLLETSSFEGNATSQNAIVPNIPTDLLPISNYLEKPAINPTAVIGTDNRQRVTDPTIDPYRKIVFMVMTFPNGVSTIGTGNLISEDTVLTAGHCVHNSNYGGWATSITVYPAYDGKIAPYGKANSKELFSVAGWTESKSSQHDIGAIKLDRNIGKETGWFGITSKLSNSITLSGYHGDFNRKMGTETGTILRYTDNNIYYLLDTNAGASGSGVYNDNKQILAVHAYAGKGENFGTRINESKFQVIQDWMTTHYDKILDRDTRDYQAIVKEAAISKAYNITDDIPFTAGGINELGTGEAYAGKKVTILEYAQTEKGTYLLFSLNGKTIGWMDSQAFTPKLDKVTITPTSITGTIREAAISSLYKISTHPTNTSTDSKIIGLGNLYEKQSVQVLNLVKLPTGNTLYQFSFNGTIIGWLDSRAFLVYDEILERDSRDYNAVVKEAAISKYHGITDDVNDTRPGIGRLGTGDKYAGQKVKILEYAKTVKGTYLKFSINGQIIGWMDSLAFTPKLDTVTVVPTKQTGKIRPASVSSLYTIYTLPNNTSIDGKIVGAGDKYANQEVSITNVGKLSTGDIVYQFSFDGKTIGWLDSRSFLAYDPITERDAREYDAVVKAASISKYHGITDDVNDSRPGIKKLGTGDKYAGQKVKILEYAKTVKGTYLKFSVNGQVIGWMDSLAFTPTLDKVTISSVKWTAIIKANLISRKYDLYTEPKNTSIDSKKIGTGELYCNRDIVINKVGRMSDGTTVYQFSLNGKTIGWIDSRAVTIK